MFNQNIMFVLTSVGCFFSNIACKKWCIDMNNRRENTSPFSSDLVVVGGLGVVLIHALVFYGGV